MSCHDQHYVGVRCQSIGSRYLAAWVTAWEHDLEVLSA
jgi:hypothetical protein